METKNHCPNCGKPLETGTLEGLCPACLMKGGWPSAPSASRSDSGFLPPGLDALAAIFPQLEILELIGKGGMGAVYKARQPQLDRDVALKILIPKGADDPGFAERFSREARALARLSHPNIVAVYDFGHVEELHYFLMEFVDGPNLRDVEKAGEMSPREALLVIPQICAALQFAHDEGIVHRDIKPENILLDRKGRVKIADFGLAKILGHEIQDLRLTQPGHVMGTPHYMAPEQVEHPEEVDHRADIYSLGVVFYEMLTGELPLGKFAPPSNKVQVDVRLDEVVLRTLEKEPLRRYQQASEVSTDVQTIVERPSGTKVDHGGNGSAFEYRSRRTLWGLPLVHITRGLDPVTGQPREARGIIAIGQRARGVVAIGGLAIGGIAFGGCAVGLIGFGGCGVGLVGFGGLAIGLVLALGGLAIGPIALGGGAIGYLAYGGGAWGVHPYSGLGRDPTAMAFFQPWVVSLLLNSYWLWVPPLLVILLVGEVLPAWLMSRSQRGKGHKGMRSMWINLVIALIFLVTLALLRFGAIQVKTTREVVTHQRGYGPIASSGTLVSRSLSPSQLERLSNSKVIEAGLANLESPWPWKELRERVENGRLTSVEVDGLLDELVSWVRRAHPNGHRRIHHDLDKLLEELHEGGLMSEEQVLRYLTAMYGDLMMHPLPRLREGESILTIANEASPSNFQQLFGLILLSELGSVSVDGTPVDVLDVGGMTRFMPLYVSVQMKLPVLSPGIHRVRCDVLNALVRQKDMVGLDGEARSEDWPPARKRWTRSWQGEFVVYARDAELVTLTDDPTLDPVANGAISIDRIVIRAQEGERVAILPIKVGTIPVSISFDVTLVLAGQSIDCGSFWMERPSEDKTSSRGNYTLTGTVTSFESTVKTAAVILRPNPQPIEHRPGVDRIWGKAIAIHKIPLIRHDQGQP